MAPRGACLLYRRPRGPRDETGTEVPEDMSDTMIEAWASENAAEQAVLVAFAASLHAATGIPYSDHSGVGC